MFESEVITQLLEQCKKVAVFLVTIDNRLEEMACRLAQDGVILEAYVLDTIGSGAAENMTKIVQGRIGEVARAQELCTSRRFSPCYCDWGIGQQKIVFRAMNGGSMEVHLSDSCMMVSQKSTSGIIGIGPCNGNVEGYNPCKNCSRRNLSGEEVE